VDRDPYWKTSEDEADDVTPNADFIDMLNGKGLNPSLDITVVRLWNEIKQAHRIDVLAKFLNNP